MILSTPVREQRRGVYNFQHRQKLNYLLKGAPGFHAMYELAARTNKFRSFNNCRYAQQKEAIIEQPSKKQVL